MITDDDGCTCPLCRYEQAVHFHKDSARYYLRCQNCLLVFVTEQFWLGKNEEKATYDLHENSGDDPGYLRFLTRLSSPLLQRLEPERTGLDFGCGPGPALKTLLEEHGHRLDLYDPHYFHDPSVFQNTYDFISATEVVEHLRHPGREFETLFTLLKPGGWLGVMTKLVLDQEAFSRWHYIRDRTHICFYSRATFEYIARRFNADLTFIGSDVILLHKK